MTAVAIPADRPARLYIVAGRRGEATDWARAQGIPPSQWTFAGCDSGRGLTRIRVAYVGGWREHRDLAAIEHAFDIVRATGVVAIITEDRP